MRSSPARRAILAVTILMSCSLAGWAQQTPAKNSPPAPAADKAQPEPYTSDTPDLLRETQLGVRHAGYTGLIWWIPFEFWQQSGVERGVSAEQMEKALGSLKEYTIIGVFAAKVSDLGAFDFISSADLEKNTFLRDAAGKEYPVVKEPSQEARNLAAMMKPILSAAMGKAGENFEMLFFPAKTKEGVAIADANQKGKFSVVMRNILGEPETVYLWRLPLTSLAAPKYCPAGKERVNLNWEYCPWHGVALNASSVH
jgi:hypothetical protein